MSLHGIDPIIFLDEEYEIEVDYEFDEGIPTIYGVEILKQVSKKGEVWYDEKGNPHFGEYWLRRDILDLLSPQQIKGMAKEILQRENAKADERQAEIAAERYTNYREIGFHRFERG